MSVDIAQKAHMEAMKANQRIDDHITVCSERHSDITDGIKDLRTDLKKMTWRLITAMATAMLMGSSIIQDY